MSPSRQVNPDKKLYAVLKSFNIIHQKTKSFKIIFALFHVAWNFDFPFLKFNFDSNYK